MHPQLEEVRREYVAAHDRLHRLMEQVPDDVWQQRPEPGSWSAAECVAHLNLTAHHYRPVVTAAIEECRRWGDPAPARFRRDPIGWLLWRTAGPPVRMRARTTANFIPADTPPAADLVAEFDELQAEQLQWIAEADGLPIDRVRITSPYDARIRYNLFSCLTILPRHQHRHLWQAERAAAALGHSAAPAHKLAG